MIIFDTLSWGNMFSYGPTNALKLNKSPVTQLVGFNGNGKSSIPLILEEVLFNKNSKGTKRQDVLNRNQTEKSYWAKLTFSVNEDQYEINIKRTSTHAIRLTKNGTDISGHTATQTLETIQTLLGYDFKTFSQVAYQNSSSSLQFLTATDTNRKKFLIDILLLDRYVELFEKFKAHHKEVSDKLSTVTAAHDATLSWLNKYQKESLDMKDLVPIPEFPTELEIEVSSLTTQYSAADSRNKKISSNSQYKKMRSALPSVQRIDPKKPTDLLTRTVGTLEAKKNSSKSMQTKLGSLGDECPTCLQTVDAAFKQNLLDEAKKDFAQANLEIEMCNAELKKIKEFNDQISKNEQILADFEKYSSLIDTTLPDLLVDKSELTTQLAETRGKIEAIKLAIRTAEALNKSVTIHNTKVTTIIEQLDSYKEKLRTSQVDLDTLDEELSYLEVLKKAFSTNGLLAYKIESSVKDLEEMSNYYLTELSSGRFQISYTINNDKLNVIITDNGKDVTIEALSAGELARVTTSTLLAIRKLMSKISKNKINVLFLDETIDTLDSEGRDKLIELLLAEPDINVFLVSHSYSHPLLDKLTVVKENNISRLEEI